MRALLGFLKGNFCRKVFSIFTFNNWGIDSKDYIVGNTNNREGMGKWVDIGEWRDVGEWGDIGDWGKLGESTLVCKERVNRDKYGRVLK